MHSVAAYVAALQPTAKAPGSDGEVTVSAPNMPSDVGSYGSVWVDSSYMRGLAQRCTRVARDCPHLPTSHELEALGVELMQKAAELDDLNQPSPRDHASGKTVSRQKYRKNKKYRRNKKYRANKKLPKK